MRICVGQILGAHGVRGLVKLASFTEDPEAITQYGELTDEAGARVFDVALVGANKGHWIARIDSVDDVVALATRVHAVAGWNAEIYADAAALGPHVDRLSRMAAPLSIDHLGMTQAVCGCCSILPRRA